MNYESLSARQIRAVRIANGIKQYEFAELIGVPIGTWTNVENGHQNLWSDMRAKATQALKELGCDFSVLEENIDFPKFAHAINKAVKEIKEEQINLGESEVEIIKDTIPEQVVAGVSKDEPRETNEHGGSQSRVLYDFSLADPKAMFEMTKVLKEGADKYGRENWRLIPIEDHLNHMLIHTYAYLAGDMSDEHLSHIMCRALFAQGVAVQTEDDIKRVKQQEG